MVTTNEGLFTQPDNGYYNQPATSVSEGAPQEGGALETDAIINGDDLRVGAFSIPTAEFREVARINLNLATDMGNRSLLGAKIEEDTISGADNTDGQETELSIDPKTDDNT